MMHEMSKANPELTCLLTEGIFNLPHHIATVREELTFDDTAGKWMANQINVRAVTEFIPLPPASETQRLNQLSYLITHHNKQKGG